jgi:hypothetical protein
MNSLVQPLFAGSLDIVGDVHGELDALRELLRHLGYNAEGTHAEGRRLVFVGDLTDRGPDSPAVVALVRQLVERGSAQCVLGNHELNILLDHPKHENRWFYGQEFVDDEDTVIPQELADETQRYEILRFFDRLPIALERGDLRVVHACWDQRMIDIVRQATDAKLLYEQHHARIEDQIAARGDLDPTAQTLLHQNENPVKLLTSGPEEFCAEPVLRAGKMRHERRVPWWNAYRDTGCVVGHYAMPETADRDARSVFCVDYGVGKRWTERRQGTSGGFAWKLAALRIPETTLVFDEGQVRSVNFDLLATESRGPTLET